MVSIGQKLHDAIVLANHLNPPSKVTFLSIFYGKMLFLVVRLLKTESNNTFKVPTDMSSGETVGAKSPSGIILNFKQKSSQYLVIKLTQPFITFSEPFI